MTQIDYAKSPYFYPVIGKRHLMRNGEVTGVVKLLDDKFYPLHDGDETWTRNGEALKGGKGPYDIVALAPGEAAEGTVEAQVEIEATRDASGSIKAAAWAILEGYEKRINDESIAGFMKSAEKLLHDMKTFAEEAGLVTVEKGGRNNE